MNRTTTWSYRTGEKGRNRNRVRAFEDPRTGILYLEYYEARNGASTLKRKRISLEHRDTEKAKQQADSAAAALGDEETLQSSEELTLWELFDIYLGEVTPLKSEGKQAHDKRCARMMKKFFGKSRRISTLNRRDWDRFVHERRRGAVAPEKAGKKGVGNRQIAYDLKFLLAVLNWATLAGDGSGKPLIERNLFKGLPIPREESPNRPILRDERYQKMLSVAEKVDWRFRVALVLAHETGHRVGAVRKLRWLDVDLEEKLLCWRGKHDKIGFEHETPLTEAGEMALQEARSQSPGIGEAFVLPSPEDNSKPCSRHVLRDWWLRAEDLAELEHVKGMGWHSLRRKFATEMKDVPLKDLCHLGGWKDAQTVLQCYQKPDEHTMRAALERRRHATNGDQESQQPTA